MFTARVCFVEANVTCSVHKGCFQANCIVGYAFENGELRKLGEREHVENAESYIVVETWHCPNPGPILPLLLTFPVRMWHGQNMI